MTEKYCARQIAQMMNLPEPTGEQIAVISYPMASALVVAGAGAGKTTTMALRVAYLVANGYVRPEQILGLTFTRRAAVELSYKIRKFTSKISAIYSEDRIFALPTIKTYHSYAYQLLAHYGMLVSLEPDITILSQTQLWRLVEQIVHTHGDLLYESLQRTISKDSRFFHRSITTIIDDVIAVMGQIHEHDIDPQQLKMIANEAESIITQWTPDNATLTKQERDFLEINFYRVALLPLIAKVTEAMHSHNAYDYGSLIPLALRLVYKDTFVSINERKNTPVVLLDEYQDTSESQRLLLKRLFGEEISDTPHTTTVMAVGDPLQSIYGWRGASAVNLPRFVSDFSTSKHTIETLYLSYSWRNAPRILNLANYIAQELYDPQLFVPQLQAATAHPEGDIAIGHFHNNYEEAKWLVNAFKKIKEDATTGTYAILTRNNIDSFLIAQECELQGLSYHIVGSAGLLMRTEIIDILAIAQVVHGIHADESLLRLLTNSRWNIGGKDLNELKRAYRDFYHTNEPFHGPIVDQQILHQEFNRVCATNNMPEFSTFILSDYDISAYTTSIAAQRITDLRKIIENLRQIAMVSVPLMMRRAVHDCGIYDYIVTNTVKDTNSTIYIDEFLNIVDQFFNQSHSSLSDFLQYCDQAVKQERGLSISEINIDSDTVMIMTIHSAKGLEFLHVGIFGVTFTDFPSTQSVSSWITSANVMPPMLRLDVSTQNLSIKDAYPQFQWPLKDKKTFRAEIRDHKEALEQRRELEERRLLYVAITRAAKTLFITGSGNKDYSPFLMDIKKWCISRGYDNSIARWYNIDNNASDGDDTHANTVTFQWPYRNVRVFDEELDQSIAEIYRKLDQESPIDISFLPDKWRKMLEYIAHFSVSDADNNKDYAGKSYNISAIAQPNSHNKSQLQGSQLYRSLYRGKRFHQWVEHRSGIRPLLDDDDIFGAFENTFELNIDEVDNPSDKEFERWRAVFDNSPWGKKIPYEVEVNILYYFSGGVIKGRIDAIYELGDGRYAILDWKTGAVPYGEDAQILAQQLALYRFIWSQVKNIPQKNIDAYFYYVRHDTIVKVDLEFTESQVLSLLNNR